MSQEHEQWLTQAVELARTKHYDEAREYALRVIREDGRNTKALWIVATVTSSLNERRNALKALLRIDPENLHARQMLQSIDQELKSNSAPTSTSTSTPSTVIRSINKPASAPQHGLLYATAALAALAIIAVVVIVIRL